ncbi:MAG: hypothetical protein RRY78_01350 [Clostridia bacterium]
MFNFLTKNKKHKKLVAKSVKSDSDIGWCLVAVLNGWRLVK